MAKVLAKKPEAIRLLWIAATTDDVVAGFSHGGLVKVKNTRYLEELLIVDLGDETMSTIKDVELFIKLWAKNYDDEEWGLTEYLKEEKATAKPKKKKKK